MKITIEKGEDLVIRLSGQLDTLAATEFEKEIKEVLKSDSNHIILNGEELTYVSSAGLRLLLTLQKGMKTKGGTLRLKNIRREIMEIFNITGFSSILTIEQ
ncbi:anti-sigma B factor antagonist [Parabacteroides sp. PF5-5]|uniref:STAS domain-containing protein n=1 Tax=unclassified Parabacteroides TaxID=2649774 RepID=UPI0024767FBE|nr:MULTISPECIES: STAS domain-containing protein [unclassified Parabacteroides]MDH6304770.1 anti-sigma B factor antagonist [Parabacteroides sp. PH5-39]MDH6315615.1 anti-sigma B factor antagonist [Parabacteroides sp. PF5-13]MDH6319276.1 anti-sigma B factor antagonist [Parabacteroides sp. PH5-13]MDH6323007.1 anti-sigma B factor antagonist [Parabacteroides sp. PH5-8]MDH6326808.1 anti-sigma B factor antagonist [Parabacteroides sp. PH5-41]